MTKPRTIAIGDIHGCSTALASLLEAIDPTEADTLVTLGDYVDRGPDSRDVIDQLLGVCKKCNLIPLLGNHEILMLNSRESDAEHEFWLSCGGRQTLASYGGNLKQVPDDHIHFLENCHRFFETPTHFFVHANYQFDLSLEKQSDLLLFWEHITANVPPPHQNGKKAVVGHTPQVDGAIRDLGHLILLDTYCFGGQRLSALDMTNGIVFQAGQDGSLHQEDIPQEAR